jgi:hypothetical protein
MGVCNLEQSILSNSMPDVAQNPDEIARFNSKVYAIVSASGTFPRLPAKVAVLYLEGAFVDAADAATELGREDIAHQIQAACFKAMENPQT